MNNYVGNVPSLKNSNALNPSEVQKAKRNMAGAGTMGQGMTAGMSNYGTTMSTAGTYGLTNATSIDQYEVQQAKQKVQNSGIQNPSTNSLT